MNKSNIALIAVDYDAEADRWLLYRLLAERRPEQSIGHKRMPSWDEHCAYVASRPYLAWYIVRHLLEPVGAVCVTREHEIGIAILREHQRKGYGRDAAKAIMDRHPGCIIAHVNAENEPSCRLWESLGFKKDVVTYRWN